MIMGTNMSSHGRVSGGCLSYDEHSLRKPLLFSSTKLLEVSKLVFWEKVYMWRVRELTDWPGFAPRMHPVPGGFCNLLRWRSRHLITQNFYEFKHVRPYDIWWVHVQVRWYSPIRHRVSLRRQRSSWNRGGIQAWSPNSIRKTLGQYIPSVRISPISYINARFVNKNQQTYG